MLDDVRAAIGRDKILSLAAPKMIPVWSNAPLLPTLGLWQAGYYRRVASRVDEIAVMTYDSTMLAPWLYEQWARFQVIGISRAVQGTGARVLFGVPTSEETTWTHHPSAENMRSGLRGVIAGLNDLEASPEAVMGVAIYPHWETDAAEWAEYEKWWLGK